MNRFIGWLVCGLIVIASVGCKREIYTPPGDLDFEAVKGVTNPIKVDVYFDASYSMIGFVGPFNSIYIKTVQMMERALISGWPGSTFNYYKFGLGMDRIQRDEILHALQPGFYDDPKFKGESRIDWVVDKAVAGNLTIIVTDLFQTRADVNKLIDKLNRKFLLTGDHFAIGVIGIKSEFEGKVYDVMLDGLSFVYSTVNRKPKDFRPFYILLLGSYSDVENFYENLLNNGLAELPVKEFIILSDQLVERLASFEEAIVYQISKLKEVNSLIDPRHPCQHEKHFLIQGHPESAVSQIGIRMNLLSHTVPFDGKRIVPEISALQWIEKSGFKESESAQKALTITDFSLVDADSRLNLSACITQKHFPGDGLYCFKIVLRPQQDAYSLPRWISDWDMNQDLVNQWIKDSSGFKGNTTLNLKNLLSNLWTIIYQTHKPKIAKLYCYIKK